MKMRVEGGAGWGVEFGGERGQFLYNHFSCMIPWGGEDGGHDPAWTRTGEGGEVERARRHARSLARTLRGGTVGELDGVSMLSVLVYVSPCGDDSS